MIKFGIDALELSPAVVRALLAFASTDGQRMHLCGIGIDTGSVCATDGHAAVRFDMCTIEPGAKAPTYWNGRVFPRARVEAELKAAKGATVALHWDWAVGGPFPPLSQVEPKDGVRGSEPIAFNPQLLGRLELVSRACRRDRVPGEDVTEAIDLPAAVLVSLSDSLGCIRYEIGGSVWWPTAQHAASVSIMPMRAGAGDSWTVQRATEKVREREVEKQRKEERAKQRERDRERAKQAKAEREQAKARTKASKQKAVA